MSPAVLVRMGRRVRGLLYLAFTPGPLDYPLLQALRIYAARVAVLLLVALIMAAGCIVLVSTLALVRHSIGGS